MKKAVWYVKSTLRFVVKNFPYLVFFVLFPAVLHAFLRDDNTYFSFFTYLKPHTAKEISFYDVYSNFSMIVGDRSWLSLFVLGGYWLGVSAMAYQVEKIMRIGKRNLSGLFGGLNNNMLAALVAGLCFLVIRELACLVGSALLIAIAAIFSSGLAYVLMVIFILALFVGLLYVATPFFVWVPCLFLNGYRFGEGFIEATYLFEGKFHSIAIPVAAGFLLQQVLFLTCKLIFDQVFFPLKIVVYTVLALYYVSLAYVVYFDLTGRERVDLRKKYGAEDTQA